MSYEWRPHFPYPEPRPIQEEALDTLLSNWDDYDIFILQAPTAFGKSSVARTIQSLFRSTSYITPTNLLVDQYLQEFPDTPTLHRLDSYHCEKWDRPCPVTRAKLRQFCSLRRDDHKCQASHDLSRAKYQRGPGVYNYHTYMAHRIYRDVLIVDEAHNLLPTIRELNRVLIWQHDYKYPPNMWTYGQIQEWIATLPERVRRHKKIRLLDEATKYQVPTHIAQRTTESFNGRGTRRGTPEDRDCIKLLPVDVTQAPPVFWPRTEVHKIILMSATIGRKDIEQLGMAGRRILYIMCKSPIPPPARPIVPLDTVSVNYRSIQDGAVDKLAHEINQIAAHHQGEKGVIHVTYQLARLLRSHLESNRFQFHDRDNKRDVYQQFRDSPADKGRILVASGMYVIAKVPWQSLANPAIKHLSELDPEWFLWETMKTTIQACGRICRTPEDFGVTYILDSSFHRLYRYGREMLPEWFSEAVDSNWLQENGYGQ
jgi:Rad3-related DNA helicase